MFGPRACRMGELVFLLVLYSIVNVCRCSSGTTSSVSTAEQLIQAASEASVSQVPYLTLLLQQDIVLTTWAAPVIDVAPGAVLAIMGPGSASKPLTLDLSGARPVVRVIQGEQLRRATGQPASTRTAVPSRTCIGLQQINIICHGPPPPAFVVVCHCTGMAVQTDHF